MRVLGQWWRVGCFAALLFFIPRLAQAQSADYDPSTAVGAKDFVADFFLKWSGPNSEALPFIRSAVDDSISFYGKVMSRNEFMKAEVDFASRWPDRAYVVERGSEKVDCSEQTLTCNVTGIEDWNDFSPVRQVMSTGSANFSMSLHFLRRNTDKNPVFSIAAESGSLISSEVNHAIGISDILLGPSPSSHFATLATDSGDQSKLVTDAAIQEAGCVSSDGTVEHEGCTSVSEIDLTKILHTKDRTVFEVTQDANDSGDFPPPLSFCFVHRNVTQCQYGLYPSPAAGPDDVMDNSFIYPTSRSHYPLLLQRLYTEGGAGCGNLNNFIWAYIPGRNVFNLIWTRPYNCHTALRFETKGPLAGDIIAVDEDVTDRFPWPYGLEVYKFVPPDQLVKILYFVGKAGQGGKYVTGPGDAIDVDMPELLRRLGVSD